MKKLFKKITILLCNIVIVAGFIGNSTIISNADTFKGGFVTSKPKKEVTLYYYVKGTNYEPKAITQWADASSKLKLVKTNNIKKADIVIYYMTHSDPNRAGTVIPYNSKGKKATLNEKWKRADVYVFKHAYHNLNSSYRRETLAHEMGHALGIAHTTSCSPSIMHSGASANGTHSYKITKYDKSQLQKKWGK